MPAKRKAAQEWGEWMVPTAVKAEFYTGSFDSIEDACAMRGPYYSELQRSDLLSDLLPVPNSHNGCEFCGRQAYGTAGKVRSAVLCRQHQFDSEAWKALGLCDETCSCRASQ